MNQTIHVSGHDGARQNNFSTHDDSQTTNHIYLHPGPNQGEFDNWMRKIGSLLQVTSEHTALKPVLELITAVFEPQRVFLINHPALPDLDVGSYTEILVVLDENVMATKKVTKHILNLACFRLQNVVINFERAAKFETAISHGYPYYCLFCSEENLVFSGSPYRLQSPSTETLDVLKSELSEILEKLFTQAGVLLTEAERLRSQSPNITALMLYHCVEYLYKNVLVLNTHKSHNTHRLAKFHARVEKYMPQVYAKLSGEAIRALDQTRDAITAPFYRVNEIFDPERLFDEVAQALKVTKAVFEKRIATLFGSSDNLEQSEDSEKHVTAQKV